MKTLNLEASKLIHSLGIKCGSERNWFNEYYGDEEKWRCDNSLRYQNDKKHKTYKAYNLQELFDILPEIGEKLGWNEEKKLNPHRRMGWNSTPRAFAHNLLDTYLLSGLEGVSKEIIKLLEKHE